MKNKIILIVIMFMIILAVAGYYVINYRNTIIESQKINKQYESYYNVQMLGTEMASLINKTMDINTKEFDIQKDENGSFVENDTNSIKIYINFKYKDDYRKIGMEKIFNSGMENFIKTYSTASFKCTEINYHEKTNNVKELTFTETED